MKRQSLDNILGEKLYSPYQEQYEYIKSLLEAGKLKPVKSSGKNGKKPALFLEYWLQDEQQDYSELKQELIYDTDTRISYDYYLSNLAV